MYKFLSKNGQALAFGVGALISALFLVVWLSGSAALEAMPKEEQPNTKIFDVGLLGSAFLFVVGVLALVAFGAVQTADNFKRSVKSIIGIVVLLAVFLIAYATSSAETTGIVADAAEKMGTSPTTIKLISAGLTTTIILSVITIGSLVISEIRNFFK